jgi:hypothetical protein
MLVTGMLWSQVQCCMFFVPFDVVIPECSLFQSIKGFATAPRPYNKTCTRDSPTSESTLVAAVIIEILGYRVNVLSFYRIHNTLITVGKCNDLAMEHLLHLPVEPFLVC